jgi:histidine ammonia-lyase
MIIIDGENLKIKDVVKVARDFEKVQLKKSIIKKVEENRRVIDDIIKEKKVVYGINTGFGELANVNISMEKLNELQYNLVRSHSCGVGKYLSTDIVRAMMLLRCNSLAKGYSGIRLKILNMLIEMLNRGIHPLVPEKGSVGASGDLIPLAHIALVMIGEGVAEYKGKILKSAEIFKINKITPIKLQPKEGLALINGTQLMTAMGSLLVHDADILLKNAQIAGAMSLEALMGTDQAFREEIHKVRPHKGQIVCAKNLRRLTKNSEIIASHKNCSKVQDPYTIRCMPQVFGAVKDAIDYTKNIVEIEINSATDNPLVFTKTKECISGGNFHGQPMALALDLLGMAIAQIGSFSERRIARLLDKKLSGLPAFLVKKDRGLNSGFMLAQYVAANLVNENKILSHPASVDSIPVSANQEDFVSMGVTSAVKARQILENVQHIVAIEFLTASQALEFLKPLKPSPASMVAYKEVRKIVSPLEKDRSMSEDINRICDLVKDGKIVEKVEKEIGELN